MQGNNKKRRGGAEKYGKWDSTEKDRLGRQDDRKGTEPKKNKDFKEQNLLQSL